MYSPTGFARASLVTLDAVEEVCNRDPTKMKYGKHDFTRNKPSDPEFCV
jgi:hypothetical protein